MRVIFLADVADVAMKGEIKDVAEGYARNFLLPGKLAKVATKEALAELEAEKKKIEKAAIEDLKKVEELTTRLDGLELTISAKASETGTLYAAITPIRVQEELKRRGFVVSSNSIEIKEGPIKEAGEYEGLVHLDHGLEAEIKLIVEVM